MGTESTKSPTTASTNGQCAADGDNSKDCGSNNAIYQSCCSGLVCHKVQTWKCVKEENQYCAGHLTTSRECGGWKKSASKCCHGLVCDGKMCIGSPPTEIPTALPSKNPTAAVTESPTKIPTIPPTTSPTKSPTESPTKLPTNNPTPPPSPTSPPTDACAQTDSAPFAWQKGRKVCRWLDNQSNKGTICRRSRAQGNLPSASEACPRTCGC